MVARYGINEENLSSDPTSLLNNLIFDAGSGALYYLYADFVGISNGNCPDNINNNWFCLTDSNNTDNVIQWQILAPVLDADFNPIIDKTTGDGPDAGTVYDGTDSMIEVPTQAICEDILVGITNYII